MDVFSALGNKGHNGIIHLPWALLAITLAIFGGLRPKKETTATPWQ